MITANTAQKMTEKRAFTPDPVDVHVGSRLRLRRNLIGMSQDQMGKAVGLTFQQIQKYERGTNRMGASRLFQLSELLGVTVSWFFDGLPPDLIQKKGAASGFGDNDQESLSPTPRIGLAVNDDPVLQRRETMELIRAYYRISDPKQRRKVFELIKTMADSI